MSGRKGALLKFKNFSDADMSGNLVSPVTSIEFLDNIGIQLHFTGAPVGTFAVQVSANHMQDSQGVVTDPGNWVSLVLDPIPVASGAGDDIYIDITQISAPWIRVIYTATSGTGSLSGWITGKMI